MKQLNETLPTYQVAAVLRERMKALHISAEQVDIRSGYVGQGKATGMARKVLRERHATTELQVAERLLEAVGGLLWDIPDYSMVGVSRRFIRLRMVSCACDCGKKTLSHYITIRKNGKHQWRKKVGLDSRQTHFRDEVFIHGHKSKLPEFRQRYRETTKQAQTPERRAKTRELMQELWTPERRAKHSETVKRQWTPERRQKASERMKQQWVSKLSCEA